jgi:hypothetical protein
MDHKYYVGEGPEAKSLIAETGGAIQKFHSECQEVADEYGAEGCFTVGRCVIGLMFKEKSENDFLSLFEQNEDGYCYKPRRNFKAGKELQNRLDAIQTVRPSEFIVNKLGVSRMSAGKHLGSRTGMAMYHSVAGYNHGVLVVKIPAGEGGDPMPTVPEWLREVKESEFLAAQGL